MPAQLARETISLRDNSWSAKRTMQMAEQTPRSAPALDDSTRLAYESMRASYERIMMSWI